MSLPSTGCTLPPCLYCEGGVTFQPLILYSARLALLTIRVILLTFSCPKALAWPLTLDVGISDHFCIFFEASTLTKHVPTSKSLKRRFLCPDTIIFITRYTARKQSDLNCYTDSSFSLCDNLINNFNQSVTHILYDIAPYKIRKTFGKAKAPWRNVEKLRH